jgi:hypothetical protein
VLAGAELAGALDHAPEARCAWLACAALPALPDRACEAAAETDRPARITDGSAAPLSGAAASDAGGGAGPAWASPALDACAVAKTVAATGAEAVGAPVFAALEPLNLSGACVAAGADGADVAAADAAPVEVGAKLLSASRKF